MFKHPEKRLHFFLPFVFAMIVFVITLFALVSTVVITYFMQKIGWIRAVKETPILSFSIICLILGFIISFVVSNVPLKPVRKVIWTLDQLADGNYTARINLRGAGEIRRLNQSVNHLAEELENVELFRSDFVNDFSHEFKTPIVSIRGFAKLLKRDDLSDAEREEYLNTIIRESERLSLLSENVLNMSRLEKQTILTGQEIYNVTEQLRQTIALLYPKADERNLEIELESVEANICANKNLMNQVWVNLLDNAIKYSNPGAVIQIQGSRQPDIMQIRFISHGKIISREMAEHIFDKFYQGDRSHTGNGNGLGLAIAKRVLTLHNGSITLERYGEEETIFLVELPRN